MGRVTEQQITDALANATVDVSSLIYVTICFALLALFPILGAIGFALMGGPGTGIGLVLAFFVMLWAGCWAVSA